jgi:thiosulfate/3-mercaptopyruvate sulfurtransferase
MSAAGITESDEILVYDDANNMQAARVQWTLNMYSNFNVRVVSGGVEALKEGGAEFDSAKVEPEAAEYIAGDYQKSLIVSLEYLKSVINMPDENTVIIDTRSDEEYYSGTIPGSCHKEYVWNMYANGEYKTARDIQSTYLAEGIKPDTKIILFCKTSVRAAQTYTALKDAGYEDVRIYDGAWLEYEDVENPQTPSQDIIPTKQDAS